MLLGKGIKGNTPKRCEGIFSGRGRSHLREYDDDGVGLTGTAARPEATRNYRKTVLRRNESRVDRRGIRFKRYVYHSILVVMPGGLGLQGRAGKT